MPLKSLLRILAPGIPVLAAAAWLALAPDSPVLVEVARGYPLVALAAAAVLSWRFRRSRVVAAAIALAIVLVLPAMGDEAFSGAATSLAAGLLAPFFAILAVAADRRLGAPRALLQIAAAPALVLLGWGTLRMDEAPVQRLLERTFLDASWTAWAGLPQPALAGAVAGSLLLGALVCHRRRSLDAALLWAALGGTIALVSSAAPARGIWVLVGALALCLGMIEASHALAFRDELTDLPGRRSLNELLASLRPPYTVAIVDIDRFKSFNDRYGHDVGDQVLRMVATRLGSVSGQGRAFRSGGEEFTIVFPRSTAERARPHLDAVRRSIADTDFKVRRAARGAGTRGAGKRNAGGAGSRRRLRVTVSIGLASIGGGNRTVEDVVLSADKAMYRAKKGGRNRVVA